MPLYTPTVCEFLSFHRLYFILRTLKPAYICLDICGGTRNYLHRATHIYPRGNAHI